MLLRPRWGQGIRIPVLAPPDPDSLADLYKNPGIRDFSRTLQPFETLALNGLKLTSVPRVHSRITYGYVFVKAGKRFA